MKKATFALILFIVSASSLANDNKKAEKLYQYLCDQVEAFNKQDVELLVGNVTEDFKWYSLTANELLIETDGKQAFKQGMIEYYKAGRKSTSVIESYTVDGDRISFKEVVSHINAEGKKVSSSALGIYQYKGDKIYRAWYFID
jgi:hypothetical protein